MSAPPVEVDLNAEPTWRRVPMPGADQPLELVRLASPRDRLTIHARFPAGFARTQPGGYAVSEEFLVLEGTLEVGDDTHEPGDLVVVPAWSLRTGMRAPAGCRVLAWFGGPADFLPATGLRPGAEPVTKVATDRADPGPLAVADAGAWALGAEPGGDGVLEVVSADRTTWRRGAVRPGPRDLVRRER